MGCCDGKPVDAADQKERLAKIMSKLPQAVYAGPDEVVGLRYAMPMDDGVQRPFGRPTILADGSIEYPKGDTKPPAEINGYRRDTDNPWLFHPLWPQCSLRMCGVKLDRKTGEIDIRMACNHPQAPQFQKFVTVDVCDGCPLRARKNPPSQS